MLKLQLSVSVYRDDMLKRSLETMSKIVDYFWELIFKNQHVMEQRNGIEAALPMDEQAQVTASLWWFILRVSLTTGCHIKQFLRIFLEEMSIWIAGLQKVDRPPWRWCPLYSIKGLNRTKFRGGRNLPLFPCLTELRHLSTSLAFQLRLLQWLPGFTDLPAQTGLLFFLGPQLADGGSWDLAFMTRSPNS